MPRLSARNQYKLTAGGHLRVRYPNGPQVGLSSSRSMATKACPGVTEGGGREGDFGKEPQRRQVTKKSEPSGYQ